MSSDAQFQHVSRRGFLGLVGAGVAGAALASSGVLPCLSAPSTALAADADTVIVFAKGDPMSWCPDMTADDNAYDPVQNMFHRLTKLDTGKKAIPDAAESWDVSDDAKTITFHLRQDLKWSDGEPLTSADVVYTFQTIHDNPEYYLSATLSTVEGFDAPDDYTVVFNMKTPDMSIVSTIGWYAGFILPKHVYDNGQDWGDNEAAKLTGTPVTSGPYKLAEYRQGQSITLEANEGYYQVPKIKRLVFSIIADPSTSVQALQNAELDYLDDVPSSSVSVLQADPSLKLVLNEYPSPVRLIYNLERTERHIDDVAVRQAIAMCIDRDSISTKAYAGVMPPETHFYPSLYADYSNDVDVAPGYDPEGARALLEQAGYEADADGYFIRGLTIDVFNSAGYDECAKLICADMATAGMECSVVSSETSAFSEKVGQRHDFDLEIQSGFMGPDAYALKNRFGTGTASNYGSYSNEEFDALCDEANATADEAKRAELYKQAQTILAQDLPYVPICAYAAYDAYAANLVNVPNDGLDKWGWREWTYAEWA